MVVAAAVGAGDVATVPGATTVCGLAFLAFLGLVVVVVLVPPPADGTNGTNTRGGEVGGGEVAGGDVTGGLVTGGGSVTGGRLMGVVSTVVSGVPGSVVWANAIGVASSVNASTNSDPMTATPIRRGPRRDPEIRDIKPDIAPGIIRPPVPYPAGTLLPFPCSRRSRSPRSGSRDRLNRGNR